jgi:hypothetical protein
MIVGYDSLEKFSPMMLHWAEKWIAIPYGDNIVVLHGIGNEPDELHQIQFLQDFELELPMDSDDDKEAPVVPTEVQQLLSLYRMSLLLKCPIHLRGNTLIQFL